MKYCLKITIEYTNDSGSFYEIVNSKVDSIIYEIKTLQSEDYWEVLTSIEQALYYEFEMYQYQVLNVSVNDFSFDSIEGALCWIIEEEYIEEIEE